MVLAHVNMLPHHHNCLPLREEGAWMNGLFDFLHWHTLLLESVRQWNENKALVFQQNENETISTNQIKTVLWHPEKVVTNKMVLSGKFY